MKSPKILGLIAGGGELPMAFAEQARSLGYSLKVVALQGEASPRIGHSDEPVCWISIGQLGSLISFFKKEKVHEAVMHGRVRHDRIFKSLKFDLKALTLLTRVKNRSGEALLKAVGNELAREGIRILDARFLMKKYLLQKGVLTRLKPRPGEMSNISYGLSVARKLAHLAIGQTLAVKKGAVVAVEAMEGTNKTIRRAGLLAGKGMVLIKTSSPKQDWRFDVPTVGLKTLEYLVRARASGLIVEAGRCFLLEKEKVVEFANRHKVFIEAVS
jgi:DUF1009 family protein